MTGQVISEQKIEEMVRLRKLGYTFNEIGSKIECSASSVRIKLKEVQVGSPRKSQKAIKLFEKLSAEIIKDYEEGRPIKRLCIDYDISKKSLLTLFDENNVPLRTKTENDSLSQLIADAKMGWGYC